MNGYPGNRRNSDIETTAHSMMVAKSDSTAKRLVDALLSSHFRDAGWSAMVWELLTEMIRHKELFAEFVANEPRRNLLRLEPEA